MKKETKLAITFILLSISIPLLCFEMYLRYKGINASYEEQVGAGGYSSPYSSHTNSQALPLFEPNERSVNKEIEFNRYINANSAGFNDREWEVKKKKKRIICLGDSFTEGIGSVGDSSYPKVLQKIITDSVDVYNAGVAGLDPILCYMILKKHLLKYSPDIILVSINTTDLNDCTIRGGFERFSTEFTKIEDKNPWWSDLYGSFFSFRYLVLNILHYNHLFLLPNEQKLADIDSKNKLIACVDSFSTICRENKIQAYFVFQAMGLEFTEKHIACQEVLDYCNSKELHTINVLDYFLKNGINDSNVKSIHWPIDGHFNNKGYRLMAKSIASELLKKGDEKQ